MSAERNETEESLTNGLFSKMLERNVKAQGVGPLTSSCYFQTFSDNG